MINQYTEHTSKVGFSLQLTITLLKNETSRRRNSHSIFSRIEALALKAILNPEGQTYDELQRALIFKQGIITLSNGIKIDTTPGYEKLLGGMKNEELPLVKVHQTFEGIISSINQLSNQPKAAQVATCSQVIKDLVSNCRNQ